ncbi:uncharacterized protein LOC110849806 [Folsomia candida]|uniref:uncharacterized protein LOC110849806 n=1 Tax=Folsomia candida TaxID=158441 RepID=UPI000B8F653F|nr:uncharacterized protein LOC110849806 [Folsomia candida]
MTSFKDFREVFVLAICNMILGPVTFIWGVYPDLKAYMDNWGVNHSNEKELELALQYNPLVWGYGFLISCSFISGLCAFLAITVFCNDCDWEIKLGNAAAYLARALVCLIPVLLFYNHDPLKWGTREMFLGKLGEIKLPIFTCLYCIVVQYFFASQVVKFVVEAQNVAKFQQEEEERKKKVGRKRKSK